MAYENPRDYVSIVAGATFTTADMFKFLVLNSSGHVVLPNTTGNIAPIGTLAGVTSTTSAAGSQAVPVNIGPVVRVNMAASTLAAGGQVGSSTAGLGIAPTTDAYVWGVILKGSSGAANRIATVLRNPQGPLNGY